MTTPADRERLRQVAGEYAGIVNSEVMAKRREIWRRSNRLEARTVPFQIEDNGTFFADLTPKPRCEGAFERELEHGMLQAITNHRLIDDDRVFTPYCGISWLIGRPSLCPELRITRAPDATGRQLGYETNTPLADLPNSLHKLQRGPFTVDRDGTHRRAEIATAAFGDLLPVRIITPHTLSAGTGLVHKAVTFMGMSNFYVAMVDQPEAVHRFFDFVARENVEFLDWLEAENLILPNSGEFSVGSGSCGYTDELPRRPLKNGDKLLPSDCWGFQEAQESVGISPDMYAEFIHPYQRRTGDRYGLLYYGCCEPVHEQWPVLRNFKNLRKVTVSPWCDQESIAAAVGRGVVLSRKPHPMKLCGEAFSAAEFEAHIRETLDIARDNFVELIFRDTCTLCGAMKDRVADACRIVRGLIGRER
ncbi:MAG: hypothetical protein A3K19_10170 [Lentisphaerae bacterium RIFOXYB12_FULL_65_16]|nr:MAG: hypothetical protein A3K18_27670 [Lentisphaerae bacterium RIFOXYA12_64_32]OGV91312.1 MAG: hypothetical protein A3K19_10170 [Lentisphaerae bacterium RIFOXYB12_FULL_65_16]